MLSLSPDRALGISESIGSSETRELARPKIICHMATSIDGRLLVDRWTPPASGVAPNLLNRHYEALAERLDADGWLVGRKTMEHYADGRPRPFNNVSHFPRATHLAARSASAIAVAIDPRGKLHYGRNDVGGDHIVAVLGETVSDCYLAELRADGVSYLFAGPDGSDLALALATLKRDFGVRSLLLEGGGRTNGAFLKAGLIDELSIVVCPAVDGLSGVASIFDYVGAADERPADGQSLRHIATETLDGGYVWLRYRVERAESAQG
jgi:riboflavin biosynthesis pyrimidine reductase